MSLIVLDQNRHAPLFQQKKVPHFGVQFKLGMSKKEQQLQYKGYRCASCGISVAEIVERFGTFKRLTQFHHIDPKTKAKDYSNLIRRKISSEQLDELDKCVLLCDRCHNVIHAQDARGNLTITVELDGRKVQQKFDGTKLML